MIYFILGMVLAGVGAFAYKHYVAAKAKAAIATVKADIKAKL